jgi:hypothetical protein
MIILEKLSSQILAKSSPFQHQQLLPNMLPARFTTMKGVIHFHPQILEWLELINLERTQNRKEVRETTSWMVFFRSNASLTRLSKKAHVSQKPVRKWQAI